MRNSIIGVAVAAAALTAAGCSGSDTGGSGSSTGTGTSSSTASTSSAGSTGAGGSSSSSSSTSGTGGSPGTAPDWTCVGHPAATTTADVNLTPTIAILVYGDEHKDIVVKACLRTDVTCDNPVDTQTALASTGQATLTIPLQGAAFDGYFELTDASGTYAQQLYFAGPLTDANAIETFAVVEATPAQLAQGFGSFDATHGYVNGLVQDCQGAFASGVVETISNADGSTKITYAHAADAATESDGTFEISGAPLGAATITAKNAEGKVVQTMDILLRANAFTSTQAGVNH